MQGDERKQTDGDELVKPDTPRHVAGGGEGQTAKHQRNHETDDARFATHGVKRAKHTQERNRCAREQQHDAESTGVLRRPEALDAEDRQDDTERNHFDRSL